jgi:protein gp37
VSNTKTAISWTDKTWNPVTGCSRVSPGCGDSTGGGCYAEALSLRFGHTKRPWTAQNAAENVVCHPERLRQPLSWRQPAKIFVNSMSDLFHERVPDEFILNVWETMAAAQRHTFQILTKRPERMRDWVRKYGNVIGTDKPALTNVWLGVSVEDQRRADERIPLLMDTPAAVRFLSCEPLLGAVWLHRWIGHPRLSVDGKSWASFDEPPGIQWLITGGESGPDFRPMNVDWARSLRDQCQAAGMAFFYKQGSSRLPGRDTLLDGVEWKQFPAVPA